MSLVADYSDSDSGEELDKANNDDDDDASHLSVVVRSDEGKGEDKVLLSQDDQKTKSGRTGVKSGLQETETRNVASSNFLLSSAADSESSDDDSDEDSKKRRNQVRVKLDNPFRTFGGSTNVSKEDSVFRNPFRDKEEEKIAVLEHHVKMTDNPETALTINGKKICWNYRKRKCYLGTQCPYAHDSDVPLTDEQLKEQKVEGDLHRSAAGNPGGVNVGGGGGGMKNLFGASSSKTHLPGTASIVAGGYDSSAFFSSPHLSGSHKTSNNTNSNDADFAEQPYSKSKKRVGLTNSLIPPKKALNIYLKTKDT